MQNLKNLAKYLDIEDNVEFTGNIPNDEVLRNLTASDLFVLVSEGETFGMAYLEAAARANIVIATKNDGIDGIIKNGINGFTCNPEVVELTNLIKKVYNLSAEEKSKIFRFVISSTFLFSTIISLSISYTAPSVSTILLR